MAIFPGEAGIPSFPLNSPLHISSLTPSYHRRKDAGEGRGVEGKYIP